ncbi:uncharacterized protein LOC111355826 [Spodoptera litura]|uniref:Uncharacterized protein LOC111355826 n=1 Tax=Spodoptera litura TaxID=69820 RepID=A0A9J7E7L9_SPOLT|nr:uncharacterized protein LOC111355826 [Spodoptera litura]
MADSRHVIMLCALLVALCNCDPNCDCRWGKFHKTLIGDTKWPLKIAEGSNFLNVVIPMNEDIAGMQEIGFVCVEIQGGLQDTRSNVSVMTEYLNPRSAQVIIRLAEPTEKDIEINIQLYNKSCRNTLD